MYPIVGADYSFTWPSAGELLAAGVRDVFWYCGPAMPPKNMVDSWAAVGLNQVAIFETYSEQAQSDRGTGQANARYLRARIASIGYPDLPAAYVMSDGNRYSPSGPLPSISEYAAGVADIEQRPYIAYGNEYAVGAAMRGTPLATIDWIPETWTDRQGTGIRQLVGGVPINGIDLNHRFTELPGETPVKPKPKGGHGMWHAIRRNPQSGLIEAIRCGGSIWIGGIPDEPRGAYGVPQAVLDAKEVDGIPYAVVDDVTWGRLVTGAQMVEPLAKLAQAGPQSGGTGGVSHAELVAAAREGISGAPVTLTGKVG